MRSDEEHLLKYPAKINANELVKRKHSPIPSQAIRPLIIATLLILLGLFCIVAFIITFTDYNFFVPSSRWYFVIVSFLTIPAGSYTFFLAYMAWTRQPGYSWPMIF